MQKNPFGQNLLTAVYFVVLASVLLIAIDTRNIWQFFLAHTVGSHNSAGINYKAVSTPVFKFLDRFDALSLSAFWGAVGLVSYRAAIWFQMAFFGVRKEFKEARYVRPARFEANYWPRIIQYDLIIGGLLLGWIFSIFAFFELLLPRTVKLLNQGLDNGAFWHQVELMVGAVSLTAGGIFVLFQLSHILRSTWHGFTSET